MSRITDFSDGAERGDTTWWTFNQSAINTTEAAHGTYCYSWTSSNASFKTLSTATADFYFRCYIKYTSGAGAMVMFRAGSTALVTLTQDTVFARLNVTGATTGNTGNNSLTFGWQCLEVHYKISDTVGVLTIKIDGTQVFTFSGDSKPGSDSTIDNIRLENSSGGSPAFYADDFALDDADWCGLSYYVGLTANGAGDVTQWTPTGGANYANVSLPASDATYNTGTTGQLDNYAMTSATVGSGTVERVIPFARANNPAGGSVNIGLKTNSTNYTATVTTPTALTWLPGSEYINNPQSGNSWTQAELDAVQMTVSVP